jgi:spermidine synthase
MRQFRLIFGASTAATAAVLAIFMAGLGAGSAFLGRRADLQDRPLRFYGNLELAITVAALLSQPLMWIVAKAYFASGGSLRLGLTVATVLRLTLSVLVLGLPTFLMGGTLPAVARAVASGGDEGRRRLSLIYGANTLGAVAGTLGSTFYLLEAVGNRRTLLAAATLNLLVGVVARLTPSEHVQPDLPDRRKPLRPPLLIAAAVVGFAFLLMELVWYRMLAPLLGGSTFTFGLILAVALLGIGFGGAAYAFLGGARQATIGAFALTCSMEALAIAVPFALGDHLAILELYLRPLGETGFGGFLLAWAILAFIVVFPAAFISGIQFPLLISLLGPGEEGIGADVGAAYAWNTAGAIAGSLAGGFGLLPLLTAPGAWRLVAVVLALLSIAAARRPLPVATAVVALAATFASGPTAVWRHAGIGAGRAPRHESDNKRREWMNEERRALVWDVDGRESSVALVDTADYAFIVNGKADGSARGDAGTQVMAGLVPAILHPHPRSALVIGLGTGSTAGWLGAAPEVERVDVFELEPAVLGVARACAAVNQDVLRNRKVRIHIADAREALLTTSRRYDIIFSEPSNPYRAGIASLFTREFYVASAQRLASGGIFAQWVQTYDVDSQTIRTIYATLASVFPYIETWTTDTGDLLLIAKRVPLAYDFDRLRSRVAAEPFRSAISHTWRKESLEGFLAHFLARDSMTRALSQAEGALNTDDRTLIEFGFARGLGAESRFSMDDLASLARHRHEDQPVGNGAVDWAKVAANRASLSWVDAVGSDGSVEEVARHQIAVNADDLTKVAADWRTKPFTPANSAELALVGEALADQASSGAVPFADDLRRWQPTDADAIMARLYFRQSRLVEAAVLVERVFVSCRRDPWPTVDLIGHTFDIAGVLGHDREFTLRLYNALEKPFAAGQWEDARKMHRLQLARELEGCGPRTARALRDLEPWPPWNEATLKFRRDCYQSLLSPLARRATREYDEYMRAEPLPFNSGVSRELSGSSSGQR